MYRTTVVTVTTPVLKSDPRNFPQKTQSLTIFHYIKAKYVHTFFQEEIKHLPPDVPNNLPTILVTNFFRLSKIETAKYKRFHIKKATSYHTDRPHTITAAPRYAASVLWLSTKLRTALCWCHFLRSIGYFSRKLCTAAIPTSGQA